MWLSTSTLQITSLVILLCKLCSALDLFWFSKSDIQNETLDILPPNVSDNVYLTEAIDETNRIPSKFIMGRVKRKQYAIPYEIRSKSFNQIIRDGANTPKPGFASIRDSQPYKPTDDLPALLITILQKQDLNHLFTKYPFSKTQTTTISNIEFYYLNDNADVLKPPKGYKAVASASSIEKTMPITLPIDRVDRGKKSLSDQWYLIEHLRKRQEDLKATETPKTETSEDCSCGKHSMNTVTQLPLAFANFYSPFYQRLFTFARTEKPYTKAYKNNTIAIKINPKISTLQYLTGRRVERDEPPSALLKTTPSAKTENDRIKFFELYDSLTEAPGNKINEDANDNYEEIPKTFFKIRTHDKINENMTEPDISHESVKKHGVVERDITESVATTTFINSYDIISSTIKHLSNITDTTQMQDLTSSVLSKKKIKTANSLKVNFDDISYQESMVWSKYPFAAVYVYEQFRVHCDAAALNPYWLLASAACLSRHYQDPIGEDRSAFVAYCGDSWWNPERINYVKSIQIHPNFHPRDTLRRHVYNIGVIQVVTSMLSACPKWTPVTIMSHQYNAQSDVSVGRSVGWGLDRYDTFFSSSDLPKRSMAVYKGFIYSDRCPGNSGYSATKLISPEAAKNIYCLTLPLYDGEDNDPIHGGLLLVEERLVALYLQEERHQFGEQCAQYTGIWKLLPWVLETAKEPEEFEMFI